MCLFITNQQQLHYLLLVYCNYIYTRILRCLFFSPNLEGRFDHFVYSPLINSNYIIYLLVYCNIIYIYTRFLRCLFFSPNLEGSFDHTGLLSFFWEDTPVKGHPSTPVEGTAAAGLSLRSGGSRIRGAQSWGRIWFRGSCFISW